MPKPTEENIRKAHDYSSRAIRNLDSGKDWEGPVIYYASLALKYDPETPGAREARILAYLSAGYWKPAIKDCEALVAVQPENPLSHWLSALVYEDILNRTIDKTDDAEVEEAVQLKHFTKHCQGLSSTHYKKAFELMSAQITDSAGTPLDYVARSILHDAATTPTDSLAEPTYHKSTDTRLAVNALSDKSRTTNLVNAVALNFLQKDALAEKVYTRIRTIASERIKNAPSKEAHIRHALMYEVRGNFKQAIAAYEAALSLTTETESHKHLVHRIIHLCERYVEVTPSAEAELTRAHFYELAGYPKEALTSYIVAAHIDRPIMTPQTYLERAHANAGIIYHGKELEGIEQLRDDYMAALATSDVESRATIRRDSLTQVNNWLKIYPSSVGAFVMRAHLHAEAGRHKEAQEDFTCADTLAIATRDKERIAAAKKNLEATLKERASKTHRRGSLTLMTPAPSSLHADQAKASLSSRASHATTR